MSTLQELAATPPVPGTCEVWVNRVPCRMPAESTWEGGCVHEHVATGIEVCAGHREFAAVPFDCVACEPDHQCTALLRETGR